MTGPRHVVWNLQTKPPQVECAHCGATHPVPLPVQLSKMVEAMSKFAEGHRECPETPNDN